MPLQAPRKGDGLVQRSILITGCSSGIGLAAATVLKDRGWRVFATARAREDLSRLKDEVGVESLYLDYTEPDSIAATANHVLSATGGALSALFNNGAYGQAGAVEDVPVHAVRTQFETNVIGWHDLTCRVIPAMRAQGHGRIVANEYINKWYLFVDAMLKNRTDGALVRLVTNVAPHEDIKTADAKILEFMAKFKSQLNQFIVN